MQKNLNNVYISTFVFSSPNSENNIMQNPDCLYKRIKIFNSMFLELFIDQS